MISDKIKKTIAFLLVILFVSNKTVIAHEGVYQPDLSIQAKAGILIEATTGKVLFEHNPDDRLALASVTKIMTILLIYEAIEEEKIRWDDIVTVSEHAAGMGGSQIFLEPFEKQSVRDLVKSIVIASANDASVAMGEFISGSEESFVSVMNKKAQNLNMNNTVFKNSCGLDAEGHFSSARDIAIMSKELVLKYPEVSDLSTTWQDTIVHNTSRGAEEFGLTNTNKLVRWYNGATGLKTGSTSKALYCLSGTAIRGDLKLISVILGSPNPNTRFQEVIKMLDFGFANFKIAKGDEIGTIMGEVGVSKGKKSIVEAVIEKEVGTVISKGNSEILESEVMLYENVKAPLIAGTKIGEVFYKYNGKEVGKSNLVALENVEEASYYDIVNRLRQIWFD